MDWRRWHEEYDDPDSRLSRRLEVVQRRLTEVLDHLDVDGPRLLSLCAGDARDVIPVLSGHPAGRRVRAVVVELDADLAERARTAAVAAGLPNVEVRCADAGDPATSADVWPVDALLLCGIFGNVEPPVARHLIGRVPSMVRDGAHVIWTRGAGTGGDDPRADVRRWFADAGMAEVSFDGPPETYGVGVHRVPAGVRARPGGARLFSFVR